MIPGLDAILPHDRLEWPWALWLLAIPALLAAGAIVRRLARQRPLHPGLVYPADAGASAIAPTLRARLTALPALLRVATLVLLVLALARPQHELGRTKTSTEGIALQLVIDRSGSMEEPMVFGGEQMNRLEVVKRVASEFLTGNDDDLKGREGDLIGAIVFGTYADTIAPLTQSPALVAELLQKVEVATLRSEQGTAIGDALALALARLKRAEEEIGAANARDERKNRRADDDPTNDPSDDQDTFTIKGKAVILLTDGESNQGEIHPIQAAMLAADWGIRVYTIGIGQGKYIQMGNQRIPLGGGVDGRTLNEIAERTGGKFFMATDAEALRGVYSEIDRLERTTIETRELADYQEAFTPLALAALALLALEIFIRAAVLRRAP